MCNVIGDRVHSYGYDAENNLVSVDNGTTAGYGFNALNERVTETTSAGTVQYGFDLQGRRSTEWSSAGALLQAQYYGSAGRLAYWSATDSNIHFEHADWTGTERERTLPNTGQEGHYSSLPFGDGEAQDGTDTNAGHFAMLDQDTSSASLGLSHAMLREYHSNSGRWMSPDSYQGSYMAARPQSFNRYIYAGGSPLVFVDPSGQTFTITTSAGTYSYSDDDWYDMMDSGYGDGISIDDSGNLTCDGISCGSVSWAPDPGDMPNVGTQPANSGGTGSGANVPAQKGPMQKDCEAQAKAATADIPSGLPDKRGVVAGVIAGLISYGLPEKYGGGSALAIFVGAVVGKGVQITRNAPERNFKHAAQMTSCNAAMGYMGIPTQ